MNDLYERLQAFFDDRKIGWRLSSRIGGYWQWRGTGYDEGWEDATHEELRELHQLLGEYLEWKQ